LLLERWTENPFAPEKTLVRDVGWDKGKWKQGDQVGIKEKWGGWYDEIVQPLDDQPVDQGYTFLPLSFVSTVADQSRLSEREQRD
jgi:hypothetical protein